MKPQYKNIDIKSAGFANSDAAAWASAQGNDSLWRTPEQILVKPVYTQADLEGTPRVCIRSSPIPSWSL